MAAIWARANSQAQAGAAHLAVSRDCRLPTGLRCAASVAAVSPSCSSERAVAMAELRPDRERAGKRGGGCASAWWR